MNSKLKELYGMLDGDTSTETQFNQLWAEIVADIMATFDISKVLADDVLALIVQGYIK